MGTRSNKPWIPAFAGMTPIAYVQKDVLLAPLSVIPAKAGIQGCLRKASILLFLTFGYPLTLPAVAEDDITPDTLLSACVEGGDFLLRHQKPDGEFGYRYLADKDTYASGYNLLRHAGTCYALMELYQVTRDERYREAVDRALASLVESASPLRPEHRRPDIEAIVTETTNPDKAKLGGAALTVLAIIKYQEATGDEKWLRRAKNFAGFLLFRQEDNGRFKSRYWYEGDPDDKWESQYYPGEAILALVRLYEREPDELWLEAAKKGADWLIEVRDAGTAVEDLTHDHWLLIGLHELYLLTGKDSYLNHSKNIAKAILIKQRMSHPKAEWVGTFYTPPRSAPVATRGEGIVAVCELAEMVGEPTEVYVRSLELMAKFLMRCQITDKDSARVPNLEAARGGIRESLNGWEVRIDYVQHSVSMLLGLRRILPRDNARG